MKSIARQCSQLLVNASDADPNKIVLRSNTLAYHSVRSLPVTTASPALIWGNRAGKLLIAISACVGRSTRSTRATRSLEIFVASYCAPDCPRCLSGRPSVQVERVDRADHHTHTDGWIGFRSPGRGWTISILILRTSVNSDHRFDG
jgi:hypothetical protein